MEAPYSNSKERGGMNRGSVTKNVTDDVAANLELSFDDATPLPPHPWKGLGGAERVYAASLTNSRSDQSTGSAASTPTTRGERVGRRYTSAAGAQAEFKPRVPRVAGAAPTDERGRDVGRERGRRTVMRLALYLSFPSSSLLPPTTEKISASKTGPHVSLFWDPVRPGPDNLGRLGVLLALLHELVDHADLTVGRARVVRLRTYVPRYRTWSRPSLRTSPRRETQSQSPSARAPPTPTPGHLPGATRCTRRC